MTFSMNRRRALKTGLLSLGGLALAPHLRAGAFEHMPLLLDAQDRIYRSPLVREHFLKETSSLQSAVRLNANENPYGPPASAIKAIAESATEANRYAWRSLEALIKQLAEKEGLSAQHMMVGPGSSDLLEKTALVLFQKGGEVISADPSYMSLMSVARAVGASWKAVPCKADWAHDLKAMEAAIGPETKLIYICNPNNPTGAITPGSALLDFCRRVSEKVPVFVDEAYMELAVGADTTSMVSLVAEGRNVIVARTFSKIMGMAGLRIGYMVAQPEFLEKIGQITRSGMGIAYTSVAAATAALSDWEFQEMTLKKNQEAKVYLYEQLKKLQYNYIPSYTNFVLFPIRMQGREMLEKMRNMQVMVRAFEIKGENWCRVSIGTMDEMRQFVQALETIS